jgi:hypothetical protein
MIIDGYYDGQVVARCDESDLKTRRYLLQINAVERWVHPEDNGNKPPKESTKEKKN